MNWALIDGIAVATLATVRPELFWPALGVAIFHVVLMAATRDPAHYTPATIRRLPRHQRRGRWLPGLGLGLGLGGPFAWLSFWRRR